MNAKEIRASKIHPDTAADDAIAAWLAEIALQLAELNESLAGVPAPGQVESLKHRVSILESEVKSLEHRKIG